jgi:hypothetical protein
MIRRVRVGAVQRASKMSYLQSVYTSGVLDERLVGLLLLHAMHCVLLSSHEHTQDMCID